MHSPTLRLQLRGGRPPAAGKIPVIVDLSPGLMVTHNVRLTRPLGEGAMGCVWVADHLTLRTQVAVKFISAELASDGGEILARFVQEASIAAQIRSPHVVQIFDQGVMGDGTPYMVMELLEGESLMEWLERRGRLSVQETSTVMVHVARALRKAHEQGVVHRDIKPDNIFVHAQEDGLFCKVLDFGIAKQTKLPKMGLTNAGVMVGTPEYMSPEQVLSAKDVDYRADLWALAVTAYQMLTGHLPFYAEALGTLCVKLLDGKFQPPSELRADLAKGMDAWFLRALAHDPANRFQSAREMSQAFLRLVAERPQIGEDEESSVTALLSIIPNPELGPQNRLGSLDATVPLTSAIDETELLDPAVANTEFLDAGQLHEESSVDHEVRIAGTGTLTGSSANRRAEPKRARLGAIVGGVALGMILTVGVVLALGSKTEVPAEETPSAQAAPPVLEEDVVEDDVVPDDDGTPAEPNPDTVDDAPEASPSASASAEPEGPEQTPSSGTTGPSKRVPSKPPNDWGF